ncbi:MAG: adenylate/guanylate cyclase domain-containing protein [Prochlorothrix sp.]|nr:adenylate/guanylate cyclase domain-containing protein [Prochlorothrix sp.]
MDSSLPLSHTPAAADAVETMLEATAELAALRRRIADLETELTETQAALLSSKARHRSLLQAIPDLIMRLSATGVYLDFIEAKGINLLVKRSSDRLGKTVQDILPPLLAEQYLTAIRTALATGETQVFEYHLSVQAVVGDYEARVVPCEADEVVMIVRDITERKQMELALKQERERSERLLLNMLPASVAEQLKNSDQAIADRFEEATILFADLVDFTQLSTVLKPTALVQLLNDLFSEFDCEVEALGLEKIKTVGDAYLVVGGVPLPRSDHATAVAHLALAMRRIVAQFSQSRGLNLRIRIGINTGEVVAGVIGLKKFVYDLWGDAVNIASRMESHGLPMEIQVSESSYELLKHEFEFVDRGLIEVKGKGQMRAYLLQEYPES